MQNLNALQDLLDSCSTDLALASFLFLCRTGHLGLHINVRPTRGTVYTHMQIRARAGARLRYLYVYSPCFDNIRVKRIGPRSLGVVPTVDIAHYEYHYLSSGACAENCAIAPLSAH